jgi:16S rRNA (adenine1518-N6/adenine1519-N6)-dimethyltransferase
MEVKTLLRQFNLRPKKSLGQNFLIDDRALDQIVRAAEVDHDDMVLEIGPGLGNLTQHLANAAKHVIAVEIDQSLIPALRFVLADRSNVTLIHGDILHLDQVTLLQPATRPQDYATNAQSHYKVVANIPYYITSAIIRHLLEAAIKPKLIVLTVQLEVAQRMVAQPDDMNLLAVSVQFYGTPRIVQRIKAGAFYPNPDVDSAVVRIDLPDQPPMEVADVDAFFAIVKAGFSQKRKQLHNALAVGLSRPHEQIDRVLKRAGIDPRRRAETLTLEEWGRLTEDMKNEG